MHLDVMVDAVGEAERQVIALGAKPRGGVPGVAAGATVQSVIARATQQHHPAPLALASCRRRDRARCRGW